MSDILISYSSKDRPWVERLAKVLESYRWSVWWDRQIPTGQSFDAVIEQQLRESKCVIVVWSKDSAESDWVKTEAAKARKRKILLPVLIDEVEIPLEFSRLQTQSLIDWRDGSPHSGFDQLINDVAHLLGTPPPVEIGKPWWKRIHPLWLISLPTAVALLAVVVFMKWRLPTHIHVELTADRVEFTINGEQSDPQPILDALQIRSLTVEKFSTISLKPEALEIGNPRQYNFEKDAFPASAWNSLTMTGPKVTFTALDKMRHPKVTVESRKDDPTGGLRVDPLTVEHGANVVLETRGDRNEGLTITTSAKKPFTLSMLKQFEMIAEHVDVNGVREPVYPGQAELTYRVRLGESNRSIEVSGRADGPVTAVRFLSPQSMNLLSPNNAFPVSSLTFERQDELGNRVSALTAGGTIKYADHPEVSAVSFKPPDVIDIDSLKRFYITALALDPSRRGIKLVGDGIAGRLMTKSGDFRKDHRLTAFDVLWHNRTLFVLFTILVWMFPTSLGAYRLYKEFRR
jgi:hypothetical protein